MDPSESLLREHIRLVLERLRSLDVADDPFSIDRMRSIEDRAELRDYVSMRLELIASGSSRDVYLLSSRKVLKLAITNAEVGGKHDDRYDMRGIAQNEAEVDAYTNAHVKPILAKIYEFHPQYHWLISELVRPLKNEEEFKRLAGISSYDVYYDVYDIHRPDDEGPQHPLSRALLELQTYTGIVPSDLVSGMTSMAHQWGKTADNRLVVLDYGLTDDIYVDYY